MAQEDIARIAQAVQAVSSAQISEFGDVSLNTIVELVSAVLQNLDAQGADRSGQVSEWKSTRQGESIAPVSDMPLTTNQAAARLGMSRPFLIKLLDQGVIPFHKVGRDRRILLSDVNLYLEKRSNETMRFKTLALTHS